MRHLTTHYSCQNVWKRPEFSLKVAFKIFWESFFSVRRLNIYPEIRLWVQFCNTWDSFFFVKSLENGQHLNSECHLRCPKNHFFIEMSKKGQSLSSVYNFVMYTEPLLHLDNWKCSEFSLRETYWDIWQPIILLKMSENVQSLSSENHIEISDNPLFLSKCLKMPRV